MDSQLEKIADYIEENGHHRGYFFHHPTWLDNPPACLVGAAWRTSHPDSIIDDDEVEDWWVKNRENHPLTPLADEWWMSEDRYPTSPPLNVVTYMSDDTPVYDLLAWLRGER